MSEENGGGGSLTPGGRFQRMEEALLRIEDKLDRKVGMKEFAFLELRVTALEGGETPVGRLLLKQFEETRSEVKDLRDRGSANAREAVKLAHDLDIEVARLREEQVQRNAVGKMARQAGAWRWRLFGAVVVLAQLAEGVWVIFH